MTIGFTTTVAFGGRPIRPDKSLSRSSKPKVHLATFGDGYEQRLADGINSVKETFSVTFSNRPKAVIDDIVGYFTFLKGATAFDFTIPDTTGGGTETTVVVVCDTFSISYDSGDSYSCNATFRRVYEP